MTYKFVSGEVRLILAHSYEVEAESLDDAEDLLVEHLKKRGEVEDYMYALGGGQ